MRAAVVVAHGQVAVRDLSRPAPGPFEALVEIEACGLCGTTDRHIVEGRQAHHPSDRYPALLGHEAVGRVIEVGAGARKFKVGDRVTRPVAIWPGTQREGIHSAWGGFAEYGIVRDGNAPGGPGADYTSARQHVVPEALDLPGAVAAISVSEVASWMEKIGPLAGRSVAIGGTGFAACVMSQCARRKGAKAIIAFGRNAKKFDRLKSNGATHTILSDGATRDAVRDINAGAGADWFLDAAGQQEVFEIGLGCLRPGGQAAIYGAPDGFAYRLPLGSVGGDLSAHYFTPEDDSYFAETCRLLAEKELDTGKVLTHAWDGLESVPRALEKQAAGDVLKGFVRIKRGP